MATNTTFYLHSGGLGSSAVSTSVSVAIGTRTNLSAFYSSFTSSSGAYYPKKTGYTFGGWYTLNRNSSESGLATCTVRNKGCVAQIIQVDRDPANMLGGSGTHNFQICLLVPSTSTNYYKKTFKYYRYGNNTSGSIIKSLTTSWSTATTAYSTYHTYGDPVNTSQYLGYYRTGTLNANLVGLSCSTSDKYLHVFVYTTSTSDKLELVTYLSTSGTASYKAWSSIRSPKAMLTDLYAKWTENGYYINYSLGGGTFSTAYDTVGYHSSIYSKLINPKSTKVGYNGSNINSLSLASGTSDLMSWIYIENPARTGYTFKGWTLSNYSTATGLYYDGGSVSISSASFTNGSSKHTLYKRLNPTDNSTVTFTANWTINTYTVAYNANGHGTAPTSQTKTYGTDLTLQPFIGNLTQAGTTSSYTITGNANGGTWSGSNGSATRTPNYTYKQTYWNTNSNGTGTNYSSEGSYTTNAGATLYAIWSTDTSYSYTYTLPTGTPTWPSTTTTYTITYDLNGGTCAISSATITETRTKTFNGWFTSESGTTQRTTSSQVSASETVYARYSQGTSISSVQLPAPTKTGYVFNGWWRTPNSSETSFCLLLYTNYEADEIFTIVNQASEANLITVIQSGQSDYDPTTGESSTSFSNTPITRTFSIPASSSVNFDVGSNLRLDITSTYPITINTTLGTEEKRVGNAGTYYTPGGDITLYARWTPNDLIFSDESFSSNYNSATSFAVGAASNGTGSYTYSWTAISGFSFNTNTRTLISDASTAVGTYTINITATDNDSGVSATKVITWTINKIDSNINISITGAIKDSNEDIPIVTANTDDGTYYLGYSTTSNTNSSTVTWISANTAITSAINNISPGVTYYIWYKVIGDSNHNDTSATYFDTASYYIEAQIPTWNGTLTYNGNLQNCNNESLWNNYDASNMTIGGTTSATNIGNYTATFTLKTGRVWNDATTIVQSIIWTIEKTEPTIVLTNADGSNITSSWVGQIRRPLYSSNYFTISTNSDGAITVSSSNTAVATTAYSDSRVTNMAVADGSATITISIAEGTNYSAKTVTYSLNVITQDVVVNDSNNYTIYPPFDSEVLLNTDGKYINKNINISNEYAHCDDINMTQRTDSSGDLWSFEYNYDSMPDEDIVLYTQLTYCTKKIRIKLNRSRITTSFIINTSKIS